jgi:chromosome segregation ATPase
MVGLMEKLKEENENLKSLMTKMEDENHNLKDEINSLKKEREQIKSKIEDATLMLDKLAVEEEQEEDKSC